MRASTIRISLLVGSICFSNYLMRAGISTWVVPLTTEAGVSLAERGQLLGSFFWGYLLANFWSGVAAQIFTGYRVLAFSGMAWSVVQLLVPAIVLSDDTLNFLWYWIFLMGVFQAPMVSCSLHVISSWTQPQERGFASSMRTAFQKSGELSARLFTPLAVVTLGWRRSCYVYGVLGMGVAFLFSWLAGPDAGPTDKLKWQPLPQEEPASPPVTAHNPLVSPRVLSHVQTDHPSSREPSPSHVPSGVAVTSPQSRGGYVNTSVHNTPSGHNGGAHVVEGAAGNRLGANSVSGWRFVWQELTAQLSTPAWRLLGYPQVWAVIFVHTGANTWFYTLMSWQPTYYHDVLRVPFDQLSFYLSIPVAGSVLGSLAIGPISAAFNRQGLPVGLQRKLVLLVCYLGTSLCTFLFGLTHDPWRGTLYLTICQMLLGAADVTYFHNYMELVSTELTPFATAFGNTMATLPGAVGPIVVKALLKDAGGAPDHKNWPKIFSLIAFILLVVIAQYLYFGSATRIIISRTSGNAKKLGQNGNGLAEHTAGEKPLSVFMLSESPSKGGAGGTYVPPWELDALAA